MWKIIPPVCIILCLLLQRTNARSMTTSDVDVQNDMNDLTDQAAENRLMHSDGQFHYNSKDGSTMSIHAAYVKLLHEVKQLQTYLELCRSRGQRPTLNKPSTYGAQSNSPNLFQSPKSRVNDVVSDDDDNEAVKIAERNYYGWMDFGK